MTKESSPFEFKLIYFPKPGGRAGPDEEEELSKFVTEANGYEIKV
jgi:hypothetical protein